MSPEKLVLLLQPGEIIGTRLDTTPSHLVGHPSDAVLALGALRKMDVDIDMYFSELYHQIFDGFSEKNPLEPICKLPVQHSAPLIAEFMTRTLTGEFEDQIPDLFSRIDTTYRTLNLDDQRRRFFIELGNSVHDMDEALGTMVRQSIHPYIEIHMNDLAYGDIVELPG